jgi:hypothetical protein
MEMNDEYERELLETAWQQIRDGYSGLIRQFGPETAKQRVIDFLNWQTPSKSKGRPKREPFSGLSQLDKEILDAYDRAPFLRSGRKTLDPVYNVNPSARTVEQKEARKKHLERLRKVRRQKEEILDGYRRLCETERSGDE